jgi:magnesium chelatase subunit D
MSGEESQQSEWQDACLAAALLAVNPAQLHGIWMRARPGPVRDIWLDLVRELLPPDTPSGKLPLNAAEDST